VFPSILTVSVPVSVLVDVVVLGVGVGVFFEGGRQHCLLLGPEQYPGLKTPSFSPHPCERYLQVPPIAAQRESSPELLGVGVGVFFEGGRQHCLLLGPEQYPGLKTPSFL